MTVSETEYEKQMILALGKTIKMEMVGQELTQKQLADKVGIHRETLSRYLGAKAGYNMPIGIVFQIAEALGMTARELIEKAEDRR